MSGGQVLQPLINYRNAQAQQRGSGLLDYATPEEIEQWRRAGDLAVNWATAVAPLGMVNPGALKPGLRGEPGYAYHATNAERLEEIARTGKLRTHKPWEFTDQQTWPDGSVQKRSYFGESPEHLYQFAPEEGAPVVLRMKRGPELVKESTGDLYATKPIKAKDMEFLGADEKWYQLKELLDDL